VEYGRSHRETRALLTDLAGFGAYAEWTWSVQPLCSVAAFRGVRFAACLLVSDSLLTESWQPAFAQPAFRKQSRRLLRTLCLKTQDLAQEMYT